MMKTIIEMSEEDIKEAIRVYLANKGHIITARNVTLSKVGVDSSSDPRERSYIEASVEIRGVKDKNKN